jgi:pyruvate dehydrogenase E1 component alpha subunit|tara:strand:- start:1091 stop:2014 length:924 start_codon:yes stop_codon:yes gene_type:complete
MTEFDALEAYRRMYLIRKTEETIINEYPKSKMQTPVHLSIGQEAAAVGVMMALPEGSQVYASHRSHAPYLAMGGDLDALVGELHGAAHGSTGGFGGSMYLADPKVGFMGSFAVVGDCVSVAMGAAMASKMSGRNNTVVAYFGDSVLETGQFWEAINAAVLWELPILFICENNGYATQTPIWERQPVLNGFTGEIEMLSDRVDGLFRSAPVTDRGRWGVQSVFDTTRRMSHTPTMIEIETYRYYAHVGMEDDREWGYRSGEEIDEARAGDCLTLLGEQLAAEHGEHAMKKIWSSVNTQVREAFEKAVS